ncbi:hypothetical protein PRZ48_009221 [Zasmidium cellare]|uniref:Uncharacterized protein n=1 Tax=Zasmidium cellare TaxID=395010 RepID=A0ABR0EBS3_ZASCE|nr:hypothetical protein PRZ48_009221 [Zasmidium cellare]
MFLPMLLMLMECLAPKRGETRQQRSARISSEIAMLQKGPPPSTSSASTGEMKGPGSATGAFHAPPAAPGSDAGFLETPDEMGGPDQRMGENVSAGREGPNAQGAGRPLRTEQDVMGGEEANPGHHQEWVRRSGRREEQYFEEDGQEQDTTQPKTIRVKPTTPTFHNLVQSGNGASTIAGHNFEAVIRDRIKATAFPHAPDAQPRRMYAKDMNKRFKEHIVKKLVKGSYDSNRVSGKTFPAQPVLGDVARMTILNGSYLKGDTKKVLRKVRSLLPAAVAAKGRKPQVAKK